MIRHPQVILDNGDSACLEKVCALIVRVNWCGRAGCVCKGWGEGALTVLEKVALDGNNLHPHSVHFLRLEDIVIIVLNFNPS